MKRLDAYMGRTVALMIGLASAGLISLFLVFTFLDQVGDIEHNYTLGKVIQYLLLSTPRMFYETLPYAVLIGCLAGLGVLASNSELIVMRTSGISTWYIARAALRPALVFVILGVLVGETVLPEFERTARVIRENAMEDDITPQGGFWYREGSVYMHFNSVSHTGDLRNINQFVFEAATGNHELKQTVWAESAEFVAGAAGEVTDRAAVRGEDSYWLFRNVIITETGTSSRSRRLDTLRWETDLTPEILSAEILVEPDRMSILELRRKISYMQDQGLNTGKFELGFWTKTLQPVASLSLVFVAISFIFGPLRETTMGMRVVTGLAIGILFKFVQDLLSPASLVYGFPPLLATLLPILICIGAGYLLLRRAN